MMGISSESEASNNLVDNIHPDDLDVVLESYEKSILSGGAEVDFEVRLLKPDKTLLWVRSRFVPDTDH